MQYTHKGVFFDQLVAGLKICASRGNRDGVKYRHAAGPTFGKCAVLGS